MRRPKPPKCKKCIVVSSISPTVPYLSTLASTLPILLIPVVQVAAAYISMSDAGWPHEVSVSVGNSAFVQVWSGVERERERWGWADEVGVSVGNSAFVQVCGV